jgi:phage gp36-like protein
MTYATQQNLIDRFGEDELIQLTDRDNLGVINTTVIDRALADADAQINGYLSVRYTLPLATPVPTELERIACDLARYSLYQDRMTEIVGKRYEAAIALLRDVAAGRAKLGVSDSSNTQTSSNVAEMSATIPVFRRSDSGGFI